MDILVEIPVVLQRAGMLGTLQQAFARPLPGTATAESLTRWRLHAAQLLARVETWAAENAAFTSDVVETLVLGPVTPPRPAASIGRTSDAASDKASTSPLTFPGLMCSTYHATRLMLCLLLDKLGAVPLRPAAGYPLRSGHSTVPIAHSTPQPHPTHPPLSIAHASTTAPEQLSLTVHSTLPSLHSIPEALLPTPPLPSPHGVAPSQPQSPCHTMSGPTAAAQPSPSPRLPALPRNLQASAAASASLVLRISRALEATHPAGFDFLRSVWPLVVVATLGPGAGMSADAQRLIRRWGETRMLAGIGKIWGVGESGSAEDPR